ncbi:hypothetical protein NMG60_11021999 [Bertholletia excelsa]
MDSIFEIDQVTRAAFLQYMVHSFGCSYICLWSYLTPSNCLIFLDGFYKENNSNQPNSSSGSHEARLFDQYRQLVFDIGENGRVPGLAFRNKLPFMELKSMDLQGLARFDAQVNFYQEAGIKAAIFMSCKNGEIELGMSNDTQINLEMEMKNWFPEDFSRQERPRELPLPGDQNRPSSSSSSLRSLSMDSPEQSPFLFNIPSTSYLSESSISPLHQALQTLGQIQNPPFPTSESEVSAITKAIFAAISSPSSSSSQPPNFPLSQRSSAFKRYGSSLPPSVPGTTRVRRQNMTKRAITFLRNLRLIMTRERVQGTIPTTTQLHHMIAERKRREKLNESFQALRSLLPPGSKKDKASVLASTTEYLASLKAQVEELTKRNQQLEAQLLPIEVTKQVNDPEPSGERIDVRITNAAESTSEARVAELQVTVRGECNIQDLVIQILEFLKGVKDVKLISVEANTRVVDSVSINQMILGLKIEGDEWDESTFVEAVKRLVAHLAT